MEFGLIKLKGTRRTMGLTTIVSPLMLIYWTLSEGKEKLQGPRDPIADATAEEAIKSIIYGLDI